MRCARLRARRELDQKDAGCAASGELDRHQPPPVSSAADARRGTVRQPAVQQTEGSLAALQAGSAGRLPEVRGEAGID